MSNQKELVQIFKALGDETRLKIIEYLLYSEQCACDFTKCINKDQTTISRHLKVLIESNILISEKSGRNIRYKIKNQDIKNKLIQFGIKENKSMCC